MTCEIETATSTQKKINKITYVVSAIHKLGATETLDIKVDRLIKRELDLQENSKNQLMMFQRSRHKQDMQGII
ncbi:MAG: transposon-encoded TnpW family protein [Defluviitaleaceae bacterium]|nr:transposon-encoded TnpW family protein [Defluviitaleaceae bacterium]